MLVKLKNKEAAKSVRMIFSNGNPVTLDSFEEYRKWYLGHHDFSMFNEEEIHALLDEEQPDNYPCTPIIINYYSEIFYLSVRNITIKPHCAL